MASLKVAMVVLMCMAVMGAPIAQAITCGQVVGKVAPCLKYLQNSLPLTPPCCSGVKGLLAPARTTFDRQAICSCLKSSSTQMPGFNLGNAASLPGKCGVNIPYKISPSTDCANVK